MKNLPSCLIFVLVICCANEGALQGSRPNSLEENNSKSAEVGSELIDPGKANDSEDAIQEPSADDMVIVPTPVTGSYLVCQRQQTEDFGIIDFDCYAKDEDGSQIPAEMAVAPALYASYSQNNSIEELQRSSQLNDSIYYWNYRGQSYPGGDFTLSAVNPDGSELVVEQLPYLGIENFLRPPYLSTNLSLDSFEVRILSRYYQNHNRHSLTIFRVNQSKPAPNWSRSIPQGAREVFCTTATVDVKSTTFTYKPSIEFASMKAGDYLLVFLRDNTNCANISQPPVDMLLIGIDLNGEPQLLYSPLVDPVF